MTLTFEGQGFGWWRSWRPGSQWGQWGLGEIIVWGKAPIELTKGPL